MRKCIKRSLHKFGHGSRPGDSVRKEKTCQFDSHAGRQDGDREKTGTSGHWVTASHNKVTTLGIIL